MKRAQSPNNPDLNIVLDIFLEDIIQKKFELQMEIFQKAVYNGKRRFKLYMSYACDWRHHLML